MFVFFPMFEKKHTHTKKNTTNNNNNKKTMIFLWNDTTQSIFNKQSSVAQVS